MLARLTLTPCPDQGPVLLPASVPRGCPAPTPLKGVGRHSFPTGMLEVGWEGRAVGNLDSSMLTGASCVSGGRLEQTQPWHRLPRGRSRLFPAKLGFGSGHRALVPRGAHAFGMGCLCLGFSAVLLQGSGVCCAVGGTSGCHLRVGWGCLGQAGCGYGSILGRSLQFPCRNRLGKHIPWESSTRQKDAKGQSGAFPAQAWPAAPMPRSALSCHCVGRV